MEKFRNSNFELLRIVAMLMIVAHHYCVHGVFDFWHGGDFPTSYINSVLIAMTSGLGKIGVNIFVLITGYFMIKKDFKISRILKVYFETFFYSLFFLLVFCLLTHFHIPSKKILASIFPIGKNSYWFISAYLILSLFVPCLNKFILTTKKSLLNSLVFVSTVLWVIAPTFTTFDYYFSDLIWFFYLYFIGSSLRLEKFANIFRSKKLFKILFVVSIVFLLINSLIICAKSNVDLWKTVRFSKMNSLFIFSISIFIFHYFKNLNLKYNKFINWVSASVLGIYLFHDNLFVRPILWQNVFHPCLLIDKSYMVFYLLFSVFVVFFFGIFLDKFLAHFSNKPIENLSNFLENKFKKCLVKFLCFSRKF